jgi:hypothetical protein
MKLEYAPWLDDPDPPGYMTEAELDKLVEGAVKLMAKVRTHDFNPYHVPSGEHGGEFTTGGGGGGSTRVIQHRGGKFGMQFVSPNIEQLSFNAAKNSLEGDRQKALKMAGAEIDRQLHLSSSEQSVIGAWADGAENSTMTTVSKAEWDGIKTSAAMKGYLADQKSVLVFQEDEAGKSALYQFNVKGNLDDIHKNLLEDGIQFHTLVPREDGATVYVADVDGSAYEAVAKGAEKYDTQVDYYVGRAEFIGTTKEDGTDREQRDDARRAYGEVIKQSAIPDAQAVWNRVHHRWGEALNPDNDSFVREKNGVPNQRLVATLEEQSLGKRNFSGFLTPEGQALSVTDWHQSEAMKANTTLERVMHDGGARLFVFPEDYIGIDIYARPSAQQVHRLQQATSTAKVRAFFLDDSRRFDLPEHRGPLGVFKAQEEHHVTSRDIVNTINKVYPVMPERKAA